MSKLRGIGEALKTLENLARAIQDCTAREDRLKGELRQEIARLEKQFKANLASLEAELAEKVGKAEGSQRSRRDGLRWRTSTRASRIDDAHRRAREMRLAEIEDHEGRKISAVQRRMLEVTRTQESGQGTTEKTLKSFRRQTAELLEELDHVELKAFSAFRGYGTFQKWLLQDDAVPDPDSVDGDAEVLFEEARKHLGVTRQRLAAFRLQPLALLFYVLPPWLLSIFLVFGHVGFWFVMRHKGHLDYTWQQAGLWLGASLAGMMALHLAGRFMAGGAAMAVVRSVRKTRSLLEQTGAAATAAHEAEFGRFQAAANVETDRLNTEWNAATTEGAERRQQLEKALERKRARAQDHNERLLQLRLDRLETEVEEQVAGLNREAGRRREALTEEFERRKTEMETEQSRQWQSLETDWKIQTHAVYRTFQESLAESSRTFPDWNPEQVDSWTAPEAFVPLARFGHLTVDVPLLAGTLPVDHRLHLEGGRTIEVPLLLEFPAHGNLVLETMEESRRPAISTLNELVLRLLSVAPPGRVVFTILDPVDLGQSFAGLMHLTDHEDRLINRRIWTQPEHIEQRLAELNEHIEKVTQLYLRNEYHTIAEYNEKAGRIAEPYHFLVIADFPANFSETAIKRLQSIAASGSRCGVFLLVHWDLRKPAPDEFRTEDLRAPSLCLRAKGDVWSIVDHPLPGATFKLSQAPDPDLVKRFLQRVGECSVDSNRVEVPFDDIAPDTSQVWSLDATEELHVPIGRTGATKLQRLSLGRGTRQHVLVAGKTGSGKSTLFHVIITNLALWSSPDHVEFYLVDFKKGVEFKCYGTHRLPHARVVAIESDREFGLSVLERVDEELRRRGDLFRQAGVQDLAGYQRESGKTLPRTLLVIDEFQEFFTEDDRVAQNAALLLDRLVRQGRAFGIHVVLGSQTLGGAYTLARTTLGQMVVRIALQCNEADALLIMEDDNPAPRLLSRPGEAIYNDASGAIEGNSPFQIVWLSDQEREVWLEKIRARADQENTSWPAPVVFEGNAPAEVEENGPLSDLLESVPHTSPPAARVFLGAPNSIKGPTEVVFARQSGNNLLIVGQQDEAALAMLGIGLATLAAQYPPGGAEFYLVDASAPGSTPRHFIEQWVGRLGDAVRLLGMADLKDTMATLAQEFRKRGQAEAGSPGAPIYFFVHGLQWFKPLRAEDDFSFSLEAESGGESPGTTFNNLICEGGPMGMHVIATCDTLNNVNRQISRKALSEFERRVLFQMSANDSASLMESPKASTLGMHRAILYNAQQGTAEVFRPYALPGSAWLARLGASPAPHPS